MRRSVHRGLIPALLSLACCSAAPLVVHEAPVHLRAGTQREWRHFPEQAAGPRVSLPFQASANATEYSLLLRQRDVRNTDWAVSVNGRPLGFLVREQRELVHVLAVPPGLLRDGANAVELSGKGKDQPDDIEIRWVRIEPMPVEDLLRQASLTVEVAAPAGPMPCRITIVDGTGALVPFSSFTPGAHTAARTGVLYYAGGETRIGLPAGKYRVYASRGFEYNAPFADVTLAKGAPAKVRLELRQEVRLPGYISCDPHVHTYEVSRHGDASVDERVLTAAGEGLDLAVSTEHNTVYDYSGSLRKRGLEKWSMTVPGNEVTTSIGHFNVFPRFHRLRCRMCARSTGTS